ncbi:hypothetical protein FQR65_LT15081 [Abscondita terminalis]|nr:hypothetical protein FQR65_LT15081 [Abscondita terminalis]
MMKKYNTDPWDLCAGFMRDLLCADCPTTKRDTIIKPSEDSLSDSKKWLFQAKGFVQADYMFNTQEIGSKDGFLSSTIAMPQNNAKDSYFSIRQSQLGVEVKRPDQKFSAYIEIDLFGQNGTTAPRLRKAYVTYDKWLFGQDWSPNAPMALRQMQLRYTTTLAKKSQLSLSLEDPNVSSVTLPDNSLKWKKKALIPNFTVAYRYGGDRNYVRMAGLLSPITYEMKYNIEDPYASKTILGGGVNLSGVLYVTKLNSLKLQASYGTGISTYNGALNEEGYDAVFDVFRDNRLRTLPFFSTSAAYEHWWNAKWSSVVFYSFVHIGGSEFIPDGMIDNFQNVGANIIYQPFRKFRIEAFRCQLSTALILTIKKGYL